MKEDDSIKLAKKKKIDGSVIYVLKVFNSIHLG